MAKASSSDKNRVKSEQTNGGRESGPHGCRVGGESSGVGVERNGLFGANGDQGWDQDFDEVFGENFCQDFCQDFGQSFSQGFRQGFSQDCAQNSMPAWALTPCSRKGWRSSFISVTRSARSSRAGGAPRPVRATWVRGGRSARPSSTCSTAR